MGVETASAIIGIIAFGIEFIKILREVAENGSMKKHVSIEDSSIYLRKTAEALEASLTLAPAAGLNDPDEIERHLARKCIETAKRLAEELNKL